MRAPIVQGGLRRAKARATAHEFALGDGDAHLVANARGGIRRVGVVDGVRIDAAVALEHGDERGVLAGETRGATLGVVARGFCGARAVAPLAKRGMGGRVRGGGRGGDVVPGDVARGRSHEAEARGVEVGPELRLARRRLGERARFRRERLLQSLHRRLAHAQARRHLRDLHGFWGWLISRPPHLASRPDVVPLDAPPRVVGRAMRTRDSIARRRRLARGARSDRRVLHGAAVRPAARRSARARRSPRVSRLE